MNLQRHATLSLQVRTYARPSLLNDTKLALDIAAVMVDHMSEYFAQSYTEHMKKLGKTIVMFFFNTSTLDMVALPQYATGAMENWGLVTFRELNMVYNDESSPERHWKIGAIVCHELAHMVCF